jgi:hypothetical protein
MVFDLGNLLHLKGVPNINVDCFFQGWSIETCASTMEKFFKTIRKTPHVFLTHVKATVDQM